MPNPKTPQNSLLDTSLHSREKRSSSTHQNTDTNLPNQKTLTSHWSNPTHNKEESRTSSLQKGNPKHRNLNQMKIQKNIQQVKEHDKCPPNQTKEEVIGSLLEKKVRVMIVQMIQNLENKMELHKNRLEIRIEKMQEMFNKNQKKIKKSQSIMNNGVTEI